MIRSTAVRLTGSALLMGLVASGTSAASPQSSGSVPTEVACLELMEALLDAGAPVNVRLVESLWFTT